MHSIAQTLKGQDLNVGTEGLNVRLQVNHLDLNVGAVLIYIGLDAVTTRELPN